MGELPTLGEEAVEHRHFFGRSVGPDCSAATAEKHADAMPLPEKNRHFFRTYVKRARRLLLEPRRQVYEDLQSVRSGTLRRFLLVSGATRRRQPVQVTRLQCDVVAECVAI